MTSSKDPNLYELRYPLGEFVWPDHVSDSALKDHLDEIEQLPKMLKAEVELLSDSQLDTRHRPEGWTIRQVVHHIFDSHINGYMRFKLAVTEEKPTIRPYYEGRWAELPDAKNLSINVSIKLLQYLNERWVYFLRNLTEIELNRTFVHPEMDKEIDLKSNIALYAWHGRHHLAHIKNLKEKMGW